MKPAARKRKAASIRGSQNRTGWLFMAPAAIILVLFLVVPIFGAVWVSLSDWKGKGSPLGAEFVGFKHYEALLSGGGLAQKDLGTSLRNNMFYVILVVPLQTLLALTLAVILNKRRLKGRGFFRTAFYFPSVTSSVAISLVFLFLFTASGAINKILAWLGVNGPNWFADPRGVGHLVLNAWGIVDMNNPPAWMSNGSFMGLDLFQWISGPSVAMCAIIALAVWTTGGTFMLMFLAALQDVPVDVDEAAMVDGATAWQRFRFVTVPALKPTFYLVITLGLIGTWQVFDQIYLMGKGGPAKSTLTPAFLSYQSSFNDGKWGQGTAIAFILFAIIIVMSGIQRFVMRDNKKLPKRKRMVFVETPATSAGVAGATATATTLSKTTPSKDKI
ncbi:sugar ABC transporter permease [Nakamurella antarctica]|uniref:Sugar ABC transporter permease n=2 Tax=Nakamurella antarctica TaxID=1902245 RepID=A0A3G8ZPP4_9ACTN|nr:sugar ABC transporter permease [Nakamurella antarctica]